MAHSSIHGLKDLTIGFKAHFRDAYKSQEKEGQHNLFAVTVGSKGHKNVYSILNAVPKLRKWVGERIVRGFKAEKFEIFNDLYEGTVEVSVVDIEDDNIGLYPDQFKTFGKNAALLHTDLAFHVLLNGHEMLCFDGEPLFSTSHPEGNGVASNMTGGVGEPWFLFDQNAPVKPVIVQGRVAPTPQKDETRRFSEDIIQYGVRARAGAGPGFWPAVYMSRGPLNSTTYNDAVTMMMERNNDEGNTLGLRPTHLIVGPRNRVVGRDLIKVDRLANGATNGDAGDVELVVSTRIRA